MTTTAFVEIEEGIMVCPCGHRTNVPPERSRPQSSLAATTTQKCGGCGKEWGTPSAADCYSMDEPEKTEVSGEPEICSPSIEPGKVSLMVTMWEGGDAFGITLSTAKAREWAQLILSRAGEADALLH